MQNWYSQNNPLKLNGVAEGAIGIGLETAFRVGVGMAESVAATA